MMSQADEQLQQFSNHHTVGEETVEESTYVQPTQTRTRKSKKVRKSPGSGKKLGAGGETGATGVAVVAEVETELITLERIDNQKNQLFASCYFKRASVDEETGA